MNNNTKLRVPLDQASAYPRPPPMLVNLLQAYLFPKCPHQFFW